MVAERYNLPPESSQQSGVQINALSTTIRLSEIAGNQLRLEAGAYSIQLRRILAELRSCGLPLRTILGDDGLADSATNAFRFRRHYVDEDRGIPFLSSSDIIEFKPKRDKFLSRKLTKNATELQINLHDVLISCSGTIGNVALAGKSIEGMALSQDAIKLRTIDASTAGYLAAFLRTTYGRVQLRQSKYGSVITHIEPHHLNDILVPDLPIGVRASIGQHMLDATALRDEANALLDEADTLIHTRLGLPPLRTLSAETQSRFAVVRASKLGWRFEASYHDPLVESALQAIKNGGHSITQLGDPSLTREIRPITKFRKRVYVEHGGIPLLSSKQLFQVDPIDVKKLARGAHTKDLPEIALQQNMLAVSCSGTIGRIQIIPKYMEGWTANQHALRVIASDDVNAGYLHAWLTSDYGYLFITRNSYGSVILEIDKQMLSSVPVPIVSDAVRREIGELVLKANNLRDEAWNSERRAIGQIESAIQQRQ